MKNEIVIENTIDEIIVIVDEDDKIKEYKTRKEMVLLIIDH